MATGGTGDTLTGIVTGLLAQNYSPEISAILGVYLHGLAGDMAVEIKNDNKRGRRHDSFRYCGFSAPGIYGSS